MLIAIPRRLISTRRSKRLPNAVTEAGLPFQQGGRPLSNPVPLFCQSGHHFPCMVKKTRTRANSMKNVYLRVA
jgi:hypothetical protein